MLPTSLAPALALKADPDAAPGTSALQLWGDPRLPTALDWPKDEAGRSMHHLMQVDCAALSAPDPDFPETGTLFIFVTGSQDERNAPDLWAGEGGLRVLYWPEPVGDIAPRAHPADCPSLGEYSLLLNPRMVARPSKRKSILGRLIRRDEPERPGKVPANFGEAIALSAVPFESHPSTDPMEAITAAGQHANDQTRECGLRICQMFGHVPMDRVMGALDLDGFRHAGTDKQVAGFERMQDTPPEEGEVLLVQLCHAEDQNLDLVSLAYSLQIRITRDALRARAFDRATARVHQLEKDGLWFAPPEKPDLSVLDPAQIRAAIALRPLTPDETPISAANYFGGLPQLPEGLDWPRDGQNQPLHFLMQIDMASLPRGEELPDMPATGTVFVFHDAFDDEQSSIQTLYTAHPVTDLPPCAPPEDLAPLAPRGRYSRPNLGCFCNWYERDRIELFKGIDVQHGGTNHEPRIAFDPVVLGVHDAPIPADLDREGYDRLQNAQSALYTMAMPHEEQAFPYHRFVLDWLPNWWRGYSEGASGSRRQSDAAPLRRVPDSYPFRWSDIREATRALGERLERLDRDEQEAVEALVPEGLDGLRAATVEWYREAAGTDPLARIPAHRAEVYREWLLDLDATAAHIPPERVDEPGQERRARLDMEYIFADMMRALACPELSALYDMVLEPEGDDLPPILREAFSETIRFNRSHTKLVGYNVSHRPYPHLLFPPAYGEEDGMIPFLRLAQTPGLRVMWGDCCDMQISLPPQDLAKGEFKNATARVLW